MRKNVASVGRLGLAGIGFIGIAAITVACSSSTSGSGSGGGGAAGASTPAVAPTMTTGGSMSASAPSIPTGIGSVSAPNISGSKFCNDLGAVSKLGSSISGGSTDALNKVLQAIDALTAEAPPQLKGDLQTLSTYLHDAENGKIDTNMTSKLEKASSDIESYIKTNCHVG